MVDRNKHGLSRNIPVPIKRQVRKKSKFGCVLCRNAIYQYEHIDPEFAKAKEHDAENICLLCGGCHDKVSRGRISKETVKTAYQKVQDSDEFKKPFEELDLKSDELIIGIGSCTFEYSTVLFHINGEDLLSITPPSHGSTFPTLNGKFYDEEGNKILTINDNVWESESHLWDIEIVGTVVTIKTGKKNTSLKFDIIPPNKLTILEMDLFKDDCRIQCNEDLLLILQKQAGKYKGIGLGGVNCKGSQKAIEIDSSVLFDPKNFGLLMTGGKGIIFEGTGVSACIESGVMTIKNIQLFT